MSNLYDRTRWEHAQIERFLEVAPSLPPSATMALRRPVVEFLTGLTDQQLWQLEQRHLFPKRFKLNPTGPKNGGCAHDYREVMAWLEKRRASRGEAA